MNNNPVIVFIVIDSFRNNEANITVIIGENSKKVAAIEGPSISIPL